MKTLAVVRFRSAVIVAVACLSGLPGGGMAQQIGGVLDGGIRLGSLSELCAQAQVIIEVEVQSVFPAEARPTNNPIPPLISTDVLLRSTRVLKGPESLKEILVNQLGGVLPDGRSQSSAQVKPVKPGERYIVFLRPLSPNGIAVLPKRDFPRYSVMGEGGWVSIDAQDNVRFNSVLPFYKEYDGKPKAAVTAEIEKFVRAAGQP